MDFKVEPVKTFSQLNSQSNIYAPNHLIIDETNYSEKLKHPQYTDQLRLHSDGAVKSYNGLYHHFLLPIVGDYSHHFHLRSNYLITGQKNDLFNVDCLSNHIESVSLTTNKNSHVISKIDGFTRVETIYLQYLAANPQSSVLLDFLNLPLLTKCANQSYQITIKFTQLPPVPYELVYDIMLTCDNNYSLNLSKEDFTVVYFAKQPQNNKKKLGINFKNGQLILKQY